MCRSIKRLYVPAQPVSDNEVRAAALQFVRKVSGTRTPSRVKTAAFEHAVDEVSAAVRRMLEEMERATSS
ncbi:MAG: DUF2277 domain-containing protein [Chloroflexi bacterium]|nr:DUF2277 domain-containing protein [Chloroflexota bacterium]